MDWKIGEAKQRFSEVVREAASEPQIIRNRDQPVAAVIGGAELEEFLAWRGSQKTPSLGARLAEARRICAAEDLRVEIPPRRDRKNPLLPEKRRARRHQRA